MEPVNIYIDLDKPSGQACLVRDRVTMETLSTLALMRRDTQRTNLWFLRKAATQGVAPTVVAVTGSTIFLGAKPTASKDQADFLFSESDWNAVTVDGVTHYEGLLDCSNATFLAAFGAGASTVDITVDVRLENEDNTERVTYQFAAVAAKNVIIGDEALPPTGSEEYPPVGQIALKLAAGHYRIKSDGSFQLYNATQNKYHTLTIGGAAGAEFITIGAGEG